MKSLFRRFRQKYHSENKIRKYLLYAIGEIVLVVIGILIALQINNWNEQRKQNVNNSKFLKNLRYEIELDTIGFVEKIKNLNRINRNITESLKLLSNKQTEINKEELKVLTKAIVDMEVLTPIYKNIARNDLKLADGTLEYIDSSLNMKYQQYLEIIKTNNVIIRKLGETLQVFALKDIYSKTDLDYIGLTDAKVHFDLEELRKDRGFKNALNKSFKSRKVSIYFMERQKKLAKDLLIIINNKLKKQ